MPNFVVLGFLEVGEKFRVGWVDVVISIPTAMLHQPKVALGCLEVNEKFSVEG